MTKIIVTSGQQFTDIDAYACTLAYSELLNLIDKDSEPVLPGPLNSSITKSVKSLPTVYHTAPATNDAQYVLVDVSDPAQFAAFVNIRNLLEIYDHRSGFESYWKQNLPYGHHIEMVGSCATQIWERYKISGKDQEISYVSANLLSTAIVSNTLNFRSSVTTDRDQFAFDELKRHTRLPDDWIDIYYNELDTEIDKNIESAIKNDTKNMNVIIAQLELWHAKEILQKHMSEILRTMESYGKPDWFLTSPSISEGKNYILAKDSAVKDKLIRAIGAKFEGDLGTTDKLWLRKEIIREISKLK